MQHEEVAFILHVDVTLMLWYLVTDSPVTANKDLLMSIMFEALTCNSPAMNCAGITGLVAMVNLSDVCSDAQVSIENTANQSAFN